MPNKCTKCGRVYDTNEIILKGCECGNRLFLYYRKISDKEAAELKKQDTLEIERDIKDVLGMKKEEATVSKGSDIWNIKVKDGVYEIDIASLMMDEPIIVAGEEGRYIVGLSSAFQERVKSKKYTDRIRFWRKR